MNLTIDRMKQVAKDQSFVACVRAYLIAKAFAEAERERVDGYIKPLFELYNFYVDSKWSDRVGPPGERITDIDRLYLTDLEGKEYLEFMEECDKEHRKHGFTGPKGHCPALIAESLAIDAENLLLDEGLRQLDLGFDRTALYGEKREKMLSLLVGIALKENKDEFAVDKLMGRVA